MDANNVSKSQFMAWIDAEKGENGLKGEKGIYAAVCSQEKHAKRQYRNIDWLISILLIMQAILSAVFVALGASGKNYQKPLAILGAVNAVITAILAIIKGQGLPGRFGQYASGLAGVRREIWRLRGKFRLEEPVTHEDCKKLWDMHERVQKENDANSPEIWKIKIPPPRTPTPTPTATTTGGGAGGDAGSGAGSGVGGEANGGTGGEANGGAGSGAGGEANGGAGVGAGGEANGGGGGGAGGGARAVQLNLL